MPTLIQVLRVKLWWNTIWVVVLRRTISSENTESPVCLNLFPLTTLQMFFSGAFSSLFFFFLFALFQLMFGWQQWPRPVRCHATLKSGWCWLSCAAPSSHLKTPVSCLHCVLRHVCALHFPVISIQFLTCWTSPSPLLCMQTHLYVQVSLLLSGFVFCLFCLGVFFFFAIVLYQIQCS